MPAPTVTDVSPPIGAAVGSSVVTITGTDFTGATGVTFGGVAATGVTVVNDTTITCTTPAGSAGVASVLVTNGSGTNSSNSLFFYVQSTPADTYIYLKGGRGDGFVPQWTGYFTDYLKEEKSEPYRDIFQTAATASAGGISGVSGATSVTFPGSVTEMTGGYATAPSMTVVTSTASDEAAHEPPRQFDRSATWRAYTSSNGLAYHFRLDSILGIGSAVRQ